MAQIRNFDQVLFRKSFSNSGGKEVIAIPNLIALQKESYDRFLQAKIPHEQRENVGIQSVFHSFFVFKLLLSRVFVLKSVDTTHFFVFKKLLWALTNRPFLGPFCMRKWRNACAKCWWRA
jgi:hypothetical protein